MIEAEARALMALPKWGDPPQAWSQHRTHLGMATLEFGVTDAVGAAITGMHVELAVLRHRRLRISSLKFTLFSLQGVHLERAYQLNVAGRAGLRPTDHDFPHEHMGPTRYQGAPAWCNLDLVGALALFCQRCNLTLTIAVPDVDAFALEP